VTVVASAMISVSGAESMHHLTEVSDQTASVWRVLG